MGHIYEKLNDLGKAIELLDKFLAICEDEDTPEGKQKVLEAHKELGEVHAKNGNVHAAIKHFEDLRKLASQDKHNRKSQADAYLKLGLLNYQEGRVKQSVDALRRHFNLAKDDEDTESKD